MKKILLFSLTLGLTVSLANAQFDEQFTGNKANLGTVNNGTEYGAGQATITFENDQVVSNYAWPKPDWFQRSLFFDFTDSVNCATHPTLEVKFMVADNDFDSIPVRFDLKGYGWIGGEEKAGMETNGKPWELKVANGEWVTASDNFTTSGRWYCTYYNAGIAASTVDSTRISGFEAFSHFGDASKYTNIAGTLTIDYIKLTDAVTGIEKIVFGNKSAFSLAVYPNPTSDVINVNAENMISSVQVLDVTGKAVKTVENNNSKKVRINVSDLSSGVYIVSVKDIDGVTAVKKFQIK